MPVFLSLIRAPALKGNSEKATMCPLGGMWSGGLGMQLWLTDWLTSPPHKQSPTTSSGGGVAHLQWRHLSPSITFSGVEGTQLSISKEGPGGILGVRYFGPGARDAT